jgi:hypothetical protein
MSHDDFQPPDFDVPDMDDDDRMHGALSDLAGIDTHDTNLRDHPKAYEVLDRLMTHAYGDGRKDEWQEWLPVLEALRRAVDALDALTDKVDRTGFAESDEFNRALDEIDLGRAAIAKVQGEQQ